ncbi:hypothetical protein ARMGADRAFT_77374 [Armillaria gallica]|uniref:Uncharacterized protein n=1 Tax=Armillaria gallica TaxID=47427 RepID=A0A2H3CBG2_ARMGA|nr:hypothetical protein ARMGADRAFT_77374 [Armillaria gallica]
MMNLGIRLSNDTWIHQRHRYRHLAQCHLFPPPPFEPSNYSTASLVCTEGAFSARRSGCLCMRRVGILVNQASRGFIQGYHTLAIPTCGSAFQKVQSTEQFYFALQDYCMDSLYPLVHLQLLGLCNRASNTSMVSTIDHCLSFLLTLSLFIAVGTAVTAPSIFSAVFC